MSSTKTGATEQVKIADLFTKTAELDAEHRKETAKMVSTLLPILAWLNEPVVLRPSSLGGAFAQFRSVTLETGGIVVMTDYQGRISSREMTTLQTEEFLAILRESFPELQRMTANRRRVREIKPVLSLKIVVGGSKILGRSYRVLVSNSGGACTGLTFSTQLHGEKEVVSKPCELAHGKEEEVDLGVFGDVGDSLPVRVDCKDADGREFFGEETVVLESSEAKEALLRRKN